MKTASIGLLATAVLAFALATTAFAQSKGVSDSKGGPYKGTASQEEVHTVPEPGTLALLALGVGGAVFFVRRRRK